jgi:iron complex outermembrane receptor protein
VVPAGNRIPGIPRGSAFAELVYRHAPWGLEAGLELRYVGKIAGRRPEHRLRPSATLWNLRLCAGAEFEPLDRA